MYGYIYETTNLINKKKYIGKHKSSFFDDKYYGSGKSFRKDLIEYGKENFSIRILEECNSQKELDKKETYYIELFDAVKSPKFYNNSYGGENEGWEGVNRMYKDNPQKWKENRLKSSNSQKGQTKSIETRNKISKALKGKSKSKEHIEHLRGAKHKLTEEQKYNIGLNFKTLGKESPLKGLTKNNSETLMRLSNSIKKTKNSREWKETTGKEAAKKLSKTRKERGLSKGKNNPMYGTKTKYVSNVEKDLVKRVNLDEVDKYLLDGWTLGNIHKQK